jgi:HK97 family phage major capsid protein
MTLAELREHVQGLGNRIQTMATEHAARRDAGEEPWPDDTRATWEQVNREYDEGLEQIRAEEEAAEVAARAAAAREWSERGHQDGVGPDDTADPLNPGTTYRQIGGTDRAEATRMFETQRDQSLCFQSWAVRGTDIESERITDDHRAAIERQGFNVDTRDLRLEMPGTQEFRGLQSRLQAAHPERHPEIGQGYIEGRALNTGVGASGGFVTLPATVVRTIELAKISYAAMMGVAEIMTTATGEEMGWPVGDDTSNEGAYTDENVDESASTADPTFEAVKWGAYTLQSKFVKVPYKTLRDSFLNLEVVLGQMIGERLGRKLATETTTGAAKIRGVITRAAAGQTAAATTSIAYADILGLEHSIDPAIRNGSRFMFHDAVLEAIRGITDAVGGRPLWMPNVMLGVPDTFNGRPFDINQKMASTIEASAKTMLFGQMRNYKIRRVGPSLRLRRLVERFAESDQIAFIGYADYDANLLRPQQDAACPIKYLIQAAS